MSSSFLLNEIYSCLQGEGPKLGHPALLVRFQICNLRCSWCDTSYTHTAQSDSLAKKFRIELSELVQKIKSFPETHLILTGGEPTLQNLGLLMRTLGNSYSAEVESNGTRIPHKHIAGFLESDYDLMQWNISPKFSNANEGIVEESLMHWSSLSHKHKKVFFKFVIRKAFCEIDMKETLALVEEYNIPRDRIFLMPEGVSVESQIGNVWLVDQCLKYGFKYTPRLHILMYGNKRGK